MFELTVTLVAAAVAGLILMAEPDQPAQAWLAVAFALGAAWACGRLRRRAPRPLGLAALSFQVLFFLSYPAQYLLAGLMYESSEWAPLLRSFSIRPIQAGWGEQIPVLCEICLAWTLLSACLAALLLAWGRRPAGPATTGRLAVQRSGLTVLLAGAVALATVGIPLQFYFDIGSLTTQTNGGYRIDGFLYHALVTVLPILLLAIHAEALRGGWTGTSRLALAAFVALALVETAMMSSRGYVILQMTMVVLLYVWESMRWRAAGGAVLATLCGALVLYPVVTSVRILRSNLGFTPLESLAVAWDGMQMQEQQKTILLLASRFVGYTSYLVSLQHGGERFDWSRVEPAQVLSLRDSSFTRWYTETAAGYGVGVRGHFSSPGMMGAGLVTGGAWLAWWLPALFAVLAAWTVQALSARPGPLGAVAPAVWLGNLLFIFNEGTFDLGLTRMVLTGAGLVAVAFLLRSVAGAPARSEAS